MHSTNGTLTYYIYNIENLKCHDKRVHYNALIIKIPKHLKRVSIELQYFAGAAKKLS